MNLVGLMTVRNEQAFIGLSARVALRWCDRLVILDHASADATPAILALLRAEFGERVTLLHEPDATWAEMSHRQRTLEAARDLGATHCAIIDADEVLTGNMLAWIRAEIESLSPAQLLQIPMRNMWRAIDYYRSDRSVFGCMALTTVAFADAQRLCWQDTNGYPHHHREPHGARLAKRYYWQQVDGGVMHLQFSNWRRLVAKQSWYQCMERVRFQQKPVSEIAGLYSRAMDESGIETTCATADWWREYTEIMHHLNLDLVPWYEHEIDRMFRDHGADYFAGLNLRYRPS